MSPLATANTVLELEHPNQAPPTAVCQHFVSTPRRRQHTHTNVHNIDHLSGLHVLDIHALRLCAMVAHPAQLRKHGAQAWLHLGPRHLYERQVASMGANSMNS